MNDALNKLLRVATAASNNGAYSCQDSMDIVEKCTWKYPTMLTQGEFDALHTAFLTVQLNTEAVERMMNDVFAKYMSDLSIDEIFKAAVRVIIIDCVLGL